MSWTKGIPKESGLYWLYIDKPIDFLQPRLFIAATDCHEAVYTTNLWWFDTDEEGNIVVDYELYEDKDTHYVCKQDQDNTYWMRIQQPDTDVSR